MSNSSDAPEPAFLPIAAGVEMKVLRLHPDRGMTFLIRMRSGAVAPLHGHPGGEETYLIQGALRIRNRVNHQGIAEPELVLGAGHYAFVPPGETHDGVADGDTLFLVVAPGGVTRAARAPELPRDASSDEGGARRRPADGAPT